jgi:hypothetical protein
VSTVPFLAVETLVIALRTSTRVAGSLATGNISWSGKREGTQPGLWHPSTHDTQKAQHQRQHVCGIKLFLK